MRPEEQRVFLAGLLSIWAERDERYARRRARGTPMALSRDEIEVIRVYRRREAMVLTEPERGLALAVLREWQA